METSEIKKECDDLYAIIKKANDRLTEIRSKCPHTNTFLGKYSYRVGSVIPADICSDCGHCVKTIYDINS